MIKEAIILKQFFLLLGVSFIISISNIERLIVDGDTFWAIKVGEWISLNKAFPTHDTFSWTVTGSPWVAHEWLYDFLIYIFYNNVGYYGIVLFVSIGVFAILYFMWILYDAEKKNLVLTLIIFTIVVFMLKSVMVARPQVYGYMFFIYFFYVLYRKRKLLWTLLPVTVIWANMHGSVVLGIAMVLLQLTYDIFYSYIEEKKFYINKELLLISFLVPLCSLINPYGIKLWHASYLLITNKLNMQIVEWQPPDLNDPGWLFLYGSIIIITVFVSYGKKELQNKKNFYLLSIYLLGTFYEAITGVRYFPYLAVCWGLFVLTLIPGELFSQKGWDKKVSAVFILIALFLVFSPGKFPITMEDAIDSKVWPVEAVNWLENRRTYNEYMWGGYLIYKDIPVFIDGRADIYWKDSDVFKDSLNVGLFKKDPIEIFDKYSLDQVLIPTNDPLDIFLKRIGWTEKYRDETAVIYYR